jgi:hypothetical protein
MTVDKNIKEEIKDEKEYWFRNSEGHRKEAERYLNNCLELNESHQKLYERVCDVLMENMELKARLIECHNKNTELKGDIARGVDSQKKDEFRLVGGLFGKQFHFESRDGYGNRMDFITTPIKPDYKTYKIYIEELND